LAGARMRQRENRRVYARKFKNEITRAMHVVQRGEFEGVAYRNAERCQPGI